MPSLFQNSKLVPRQAVYTDVDSPTLDLILEGPVSGSAWSELKCIYGEVWFPIRWILLRTVKVFVDDVEIAPSQYTLQVSSSVRLIPCYTYDLSRRLGDATTWFEPKAINLYYDWVPAQYKNKWVWPAYYACALSNVGSIKDMEAHLYSEQPTVRVPFFSITLPPLKPGKRKIKITARADERGAWLNWNNPYYPYITYPNYATEQTAGQPLTLETVLDIKTTTGTLVVDTQPVKGRIFINNEDAGIAPISKQLTAGDYIVSFGDVEGYITPKPVSVTVEAEKTKIVTGQYTTPTAPTAPTRISPIILGTGLLFLAASGYYLYKKKKVMK